MRASFMGQLTRIYQKQSERDGVKLSKLVAEIILPGEGSDPSVVVTAALAPEQAPDVAAGRVRVNALLRAWSMNGKHGISASGATLEAVK